MSQLVHSIEDWISKNEQFFVPPICNKLMYGDGQLKCFFVGGPNIRKDFHLEEGEELFYMMKGDMDLIVVEQNLFKSIKIKEGEIFLLPPRIPHSPQRYLNTLGLVVERERSDNEMDGLRYYMDNSLDVLYERWFQCKSLDSQLPPLIREFHTSEQFRTGKPIPGTILDIKPVQQDFERQMDEPFHLSKWLQIQKKSGKIPLFGNSYSSKVFALREGNHIQDEHFSETLLWQLEGCATLKIDEEEIPLPEGSITLIEANKTYLYF